MKQFICTLILNALLTALPISYANAFEKEYCWDALPDAVVRMAGGDDTPSLYSRRSNLEITKALKKSMDTEGENAELMKFQPEDLLIACPAYKYLKNESPQDLEKKKLIWLEIMEMIAEKESGCRNKSDNVGVMNLKKEDIFKYCNGLGDIENPQSNMKCSLKILRNKIQEQRRGNNPELSVIASSTWSKSFPNKKDTSRLSSLRSIELTKLSQLKACQPTRQQMQSTLRENAQAAENAKQKKIIDQINRPKASQKSGGQ